jgi:hypothetical protein
MVKETIGQTLTSERNKDVWYLKQLTQACRDGEIDVHTSILAVAEYITDGEDISQKKKTISSY